MIQLPHGVSECLAEVVSESIGPDEMSRLTELLRRPGLEGWVCFTDFVMPLDQVRTWGHRILSAEARDERQRESLQIRLVADGWLLTWIREGQGESTLAYDQSFLSTVPGARMRYRVHWRREDEGELRPWRPWVAAFIGWKEDR